MVDTNLANSVEWVAIAPEAVHSLNSSEIITVIRRKNCSLTAGYYRLSGNSSLNTVTREQLPLLQTMLDPQNNTATITLTFSRYKDISIARGSEFSTLHTSAAEIKIAEARISSNSTQSTGFILWLHGVLLFVNQIFLHSR